MKGKIDLIKCSYLALAFLFFINCGLLDIITGLDLVSDTYAVSDSMLVNFAKSTERIRSKTVTIPNLLRVTSVTVNIGSVSYSVSGNNVTVNVSNGSSVDSDTSSQYISNYSYHTGTSQPPGSYHYSSGGYSGSLSLYEADYNQIVVGEKQESREFTDSHDNTLSKSWDCTGTMTYTNATSPAPSSKQVNEDGYSGSIPRTGTTSGAESNTYCTGHTPSHRTGWTQTFTAHYSGTLYKTVPEYEDDWTGYYRGWVYGSTTYYYAYNVTINYVTNQASSISLLAPAQDQIFSGTAASFIPVVSVSDPDGDTLTCKLFIDSEASPRDTKTVSNTTTAQNVSFNAQNLGALSQGSHTMKFTVYDGEATIQSSVSFKVDKTSPVIGVTSTTSTESSIYISGTATDNIGLHLTPYCFVIGNNATQWTTVTNHTFYSLSPNTLYKIKFMAKDKAGYMAEKLHEVYTKAVKPAITLNTPRETSLTVTVSDNNPTYTKYLIKCGTQYVSGSGTLMGSPAWITLSGKAIIVKNLQSNRLYEFSIKARNESGSETAESDKKSAYTLAEAPQAFRAENINQTSIVLAWNTVVGAAGYDIEVDGVIKNNGTSLMYTHTGLQAESTHTYRIRTRNASGAGSWSSPLTLTTLVNPPGVPGNISYNATQTSVSIGWDTVLKAAGYDVEVDGVVQDNGTNLTYLHNGLQPDSPHRYRVRARNAGGAGEWSAYRDIRTLPYPPEPPDSINSVITKNTIELLWEVIPKTDRYDIEVDGLIIDNKNLTTYLHEGLTPFTRHQYRIRGINAGGIGKWSSYFYLTTYPFEPYIPGNVMAASDGNSISLSWFMASYAWTYEIEIDGENIVEVYGTEYIHEGLITGSQHTYRVRSKNISGTSEWTSLINITASSNLSGLGLNISNVAAVVTTDTITLSWDSVNAECQYEIEADGILIDNGFNTIFNHGGLEPETYHDYKIRVRSGTEEWGAVLSLATLSYPPGAPVISDYFATNDSIQIWWDPVEGAVSYDVEADGIVIPGITDITYLHEELLQGTTHQYRVRARTLIDISPWSEMAEINTGSTEYIVNCTAGEEFDFSLIAYNVQDFNTTTFIVLYDEEALEVADLFGATPSTDILELGQIPGTNINVRNTPGKIEFRVKGNIVPGTCWSGEITDIIFKAKITGTTTITYKSDN